MSKLTWKFQFALAISFLHGLIQRGSDLFQIMFYLKRKKKENVRLTSEIWAVGLITCWALLPSGTLVN